MASIFNCRCKVDLYYGLTLHPASLTKTCYLRRYDPQHQPQHCKGNHVALAVVQAFAPLDHSKLYAIKLVKLLTLGATLRGLEHDGRESVDCSPPTIAKSLGAIREATLLS